jgi:hypothetical protein
VVNPDGTPRPPPERTRRVTTPKEAPPEPPAPPREGPPPGASAEEKDQLNGLIAMMVAITATLMALCNVKDDNVVQAMTVAQTSSVDAWSHYQAKSTKQSLIEVMVDQLTIERELFQEHPERLRQIDQRLGDYRKRIERYEEEKKEIRRRAEGHLREYERLNVHDDQLDLAEASFSISIALFGVTALTHSRRLLILCVGFMLLGTLFGAAGFLGWSFRPEFLARLLS